VIRAGETYAIDPQIDETAARALWLEAPKACFVAERAGEILGTYYIKTNQAGGGAHVCNCGYMVSETARGQGIARAMCEHSQAEALGLGYLAMQFNLVVSTNTGAIRLWERLGFETVGVLPRAFRHPSAGFVDARVMTKWLDASTA
jgi:ribosomal protein S18 acetylase RimI-like enzyme